MIYFLTGRRSEEYVWDYAKRIGDGGGPAAGVLCYETVLAMDAVPPGLYVFTGLNRLGPNATHALKELFSSLDQRSGLEPLNSPARSLGRYELLRALHQRGINEFKVKGAWEDLSDLRFPVFVRDRSRDGGVPVLLRSMREVEVEIGWALVRGADLSELIVVEFLGTRNEDGLYRKYSAYVVGNAVIPTSLERGRHWVLRYPVAEFTIEALKEEELFVLEDPHAGQLEEVRRVAQIGFGRMDYSVYKGRVQIWEINTLPTMRHPNGSPPFPPELTPFRQAKKDLFRARFQEAWRELDPGPSPIPRIGLNLTPTSVDRALKELAGEVPSTFPHEERYGLLKAVLRPLKPIVMPLATRTIVPVFARRTIRKATRRHSPPDTGELF